MENQLKDHVNSPAHKIESGGDKKECDVFTGLGKSVENQKSLLGKDQVKNSYELKRFYESENPRVIDLKNFDSLDDLCEAVKYHWIHRLRNKEDSINKVISRAKKMAKHNVFPVDFFDLQPDQAIAYLDYREQTEEAPRYGVRNDWKVIKIFARAYGIDVSSWNYRPPREIKSKVKMIPLPNVVYALIHHEYSKDPYENALYQYLMFDSFLLGIRNPSEMVSLSVSDVFLDDGYLIIHEDKKYGQPRQVFPEKEIMTMPTRKSFKNWIDKWRPKVTNQFSGESLFLLPSGKPFTKDYLRVQLSRRGKQVWNHYHPYVSRHWCAIARLIKSKVDSNHYNVYEVKDWLGHDRLNTTENYIQFAHRYYEQAPFDWIKSILKASNILKECFSGENGVKSKKAENRVLSTEIPSVGDSSSRHRSVVVFLSYLTSEQTLY